jgi:hypothetical protein
MVKAGHPLGLSIDYMVDGWQPDGRGGRNLTQITIVGGAITPQPMNPGASVIEIKGEAVTGYAPIVGLYTDAQRRAELAARNHPDRQREDARLEAATWPPRDWPRDMRLAVLNQLEATQAKNLPAPAAEGEARRQARWERNNEYSYALARTMATCKPLR